MLLYDTRHQERTYEQDTHRVLQIIRQWTSGGNADIHVDNFDDIQEAWKRLTKFYDGIDAQNATILKARNTIANTSWIKDTANFRFENYCNKIKSANRNLDRLHANMDGRSQVISFLKGIKADNNINPHLMAFKTQILLHTVWR